MKRYPQPHPSSSEARCLLAHSYSLPYGRGSAQNCPVTPADPLAELVGTKRSAISRLENADYEGHSMAILRRIAHALGKRLVVGFVDAEPPCDERKEEHLAPV
jgi:transcriptional regulator with XRE-family HTH domain